MDREELQAKEREILIALLNYSDGKGRSHLSSMALAPADWVLELDFANALGFHTFDTTVVDWDYLDVVRRLRARGFVRRTSFPFGDYCVRLTIQGVELAQALTGRTVHVSGRGVWEDRIVSAFAGTARGFRRGLRRTASVNIRHLVIKSGS